MKFRRKCPELIPVPTTIASRELLMVLPPAPPPWKVLDYGTKPHHYTLPSRPSYYENDSPFQLGAKIQCAHCGQKWELRTMSNGDLERSFRHGYRGDGLRWEIEEPEEPKTEETA